MKIVVDRAPARMLLFLCATFLSISLFVHQSAEVEELTYFQAQNGAVTIEAEHYHASIERNGRSWTARTDRAGYAGSAAMVAVPDQNVTVSGNYVAASPELQYRVRFDQAGTYYVWVRALADNYGNNTVHVGLNGQPVASAANVTMNRYRDWKWRAENLSYTINVPAPGIHTINVWMCKDGFRLDRLLLTTSRTAPSLVGPSESPISGNPVPVPTPTPAPIVKPTPVPSPSVSPAGRQFYVSPNGDLESAGTMADPLNLHTALSSGKSPARPGDTIWLRAGVYRGVFTSTLNGTAQAPITVRSYPNERATLDGETRTASTLTIKGSYTHYRDLEITRSDPKRVSLQTGSSPNDVSRGHSNGIDVVGHHVKLINLVVHDDGVGIGFWAAAINSEIYGSLIYNNGWDAPDRGHGHAIYAQNNTGLKSIKDTIMFNQFGNGLQIYGSSNAYLNNFLVEGNIIFNNGANSRTAGYSDNILIGGGSIARGNKVLNNYTYFTPSVRRGANKLGYQAGCSDALVRNNRFIAYSPLILKNCSATTITSNLFFGEANSIISQYSNNEFYGPAFPPHSNEIFVRPNAYERGRANIVVYNWEMKDFVDVDLSNVLEPGADFEVRNAQNFFGPPVLTGLYSGGLVRLPMSGLTVARATGMTTTPGPTGRQFNVFVVLPR